MNASTKLRWPSESQLQRLVPVAQRVLRADPRMSPGHTAVRNRAGHGLEFLDHRAYVAGDALRDVDWRLSARSRHSYTRRFEDEASTDWVICIDGSASMHTPNSDKWLLATQIAACMSYLLIDHGSRVALAAYNDAVVAYRPLGRGRKQYLSILAALAQAERHDHQCAGAGPDLCQRYIPDGSALCVISDFLNDDYCEPGLRRLFATARLPIHLIHMIDWSEADRLPDGALALRDCESQQQHDALVAQNFRQIVVRRLQSMSTSMAAFCRDHGAYYLAADTRNDWLNIVSTHFAALDRTRNHRNALAG